MVLRSRGRSAALPGADADVGSDDIALQTSVFGAVLTACSSNPYVSFLAPPAVVLLVGTVGTYAAAAVALIAAGLVIAFATPPSPTAMAAGVLAGAVITPRLAACVIVWAVIATTGTMALVFAGLTPIGAATVAATAAVLPAVPFIRKRPKDDAIVCEDPPVIIVTKTNAADLYL